MLSSTNAETIRKGRNPIAYCETCLWPYSCRVRSDDRDVGPQTIQWEHGTVAFDKKSRDHICSKLNVSPEWLAYGDAFPFRDCRIIKMEPRRGHNTDASNLLELAIEKSKRCDVYVYPGYAGSWIHFIICTLNDGTVRIITLCKSNGSIVRNAEISKVIDKVVWHGKIKPFRTGYNRLNETVMGKVIHSIKNDLCVCDSFLDALTSRQRGRGKLIEKHAGACGKALKNIRLSVESKLRLFK